MQRKSDTKLTRDLNSLFLYDIMIYVIVAHRFLLSSQTQFVFVYPETFYFIPLFRYMHVTTWQSFQQTHDFLFS